MNNSHYPKIIGFIAAIVIIVLAIGAWFFFHQNAVAPVSSGTGTTTGTQTPPPGAVQAISDYLNAPMLSAADTASWKTYTDPNTGFLINYPSDWTVNPSYQNSEMGPGKTLNGVSFTIPASMTKGTNLGGDTSVSVETNTFSTTCNAQEFFDPQPVTGNSTVSVNGTNYSIATATGVGAGNYYEEFVASVPGSNPCEGVHLFMHSGNIENYPAGAVVAFDRTELLSIYETMLASYQAK